MAARSCDTPRMSVAALPDLNVLPADALKALILAQHDQLIATREQLVSRETELAHLKLLIAKLQRMQFGRKSEKLQRQDRTTGVAAGRAPSEARGDQPSRESNGNTSYPFHITAPAGKPARRALPEHLPRETARAEASEV